MLIHLGGDTVVRSKDVIAILDYGKKESDIEVQSFVEFYDKKGILILVSKEDIKSIVITDQYIYGSPISSITLHRRA